MSRETTTLTVSSNVARDDRFWVAARIIDCMQASILEFFQVLAAGLEGGHSVGGVSVCRLGDTDETIFCRMGHSEDVALGVVN